MNLKSKLLLTLIATTATLLLFMHNPVNQWLCSYVSKKADIELGNLPLQTEQVEKINAIAHEMGITQNIIIRKMNQKAMVAFGYHNAFCYFPLLLNSIPISSQPYLFVSEGFLEDLSPAEQRFLIGHELIHIKERHTLYLNLFLYLFILICALISYFLITKIQKISCQEPYQKHALQVISFIIPFLLLPFPNLICLAYRRHIERVADCQSLQSLKSYEGCAQLITRWQKEFNEPADNPYGGLFSDHPSCQERISYCLQLQNSSKEIS